MSEGTPLVFAFFGTGPLAESALASLVRHGYTPALVVTKEDKKVGREHTLTAPSIKEWAVYKGIPVYQPSTLKIQDGPLFEKRFDLFIVASYGKIIPEHILELSTHGTLNVHPSLLPKLRGPSPIESALLDGDRVIGLSIMKLDKEMDHGPLLVQSQIPVEMNDTALTMEHKAGKAGGDLLASVIEHYVHGSLTPHEQEHEKATYCSFITKDMGEITLEEKESSVRRKWRALTPWPGLFFIIQKGDKDIRVKVNSLHPLQNEEKTASEIIASVTPDGKKEMIFDDFKKGYLA